MSLELLCIFRVLRFDDKTTLQKRKPTDKLGTIRNIWEMWIKNHPNLHNPEENIPADERHLEVPSNNIFFRNQRNMVSKGLFYDPETPYALSVQVYTGKEEGAPPERNQAKRVVCDLIREK